MELDTKALAKVQAGAFFRGVELKGRAHHPPAIFPEDRFYLDAWHDLNTMRPPPIVGMKKTVRSQIPWVAIHKWGLAHSLPAIDVSTLKSVIWTADRIYREWAAERDQILREASEGETAPPGTITERPR